MARIKVFFSKLFNCVCYEKSFSSKVFFQANNHALWSTEKYCVRQAKRKMPTRRVIKERLHSTNCKKIWHLHRISSILIRKHLTLFVYRYFVFSMNRIKMKKKQQQIYFFLKCVSIRFNKLPDEINIFNEIMQQNQICLVCSLCGNRLTSIHSLCLHVLFTNTIG